MANSAVPGFHPDLSRALSKDKLISFGDPHRQETRRAGRSEVQERRPAEDAEVGGELKLG